MSTLGERIKQVRLKAGITKSGLASAAGVSPSAVTQWENGDTKTLKSASVLAAAKALKVNYEWLATGKGEPVGRTGQANFGHNVSDEALEIARRFDELSAICQDHVRRQIELLRGAEANRVRRRSVQHDVEIKQDALRPGMRSKTRKVVR